MAKILRQNVGGVDFTMAGCALTGVCPTSAADYIKQITLSNGDVIEDGMMMVVTFANGNTAGNAPNTKTIYSSDQVNYFEDDQLTVPFTLAPEGCYEIEYTGTANAYTYTDYPVFQVGSVSGPVCDYRGHITSGDLWEAGDSVQCMLKEGKFVLSDRYLDSSLAYQGYARGIGIDAVYSINEFAIDDTMPDLTFFLDLKPEEGLRRIAEHRSDEVNRLDLEKLSFHEKVYEAYQILLKKYPERIVRIDASQTVEEEVQQIKKIILDKYAEKQKN